MFTEKIHHHKSLNLEGGSVRRTAVRAVIRRNDRMLMIYSPVNGDYKFPGGGVEEDEDLFTALKREVMEESGYLLKDRFKKIGLITEYSEAFEEEKDFFQMESHYYLCEIEDETPKEQTLDNYEKELKFTPLWIKPSEALLQNLEILNSDKTPPKWTRREVLFLENLDFSHI